jgi:carbamoyltransferase
MADSKTVLGISCYYHDSAAALVRGGRIVAAAQEERFDRVKYSQVFPLNAINFCLQQAEITMQDVDAVAFYEKPFLKFARVLTAHLRSYPFSLVNFIQTMPAWLEERLSFPITLRERLGFEKDVYYLKHHQSHAASTFLVSPFEEAAIITVDGIGEWASTSWGVGRGRKVSVHQELHYPDSLGLLYAAVTTFLGFPVFVGEGKVMALASYGKPVYLEQFRKLLEMGPEGSFRLNGRYFSFARGKRMYNQRFVDLLGPAKAPEEEFTQRHFDIAASLQRVTEEALLGLARHVQRETGLKKACLAGGVFLNVVANSRILEETDFDELYIQPAAGDAGGALGAACYVSHCLLDQPRTEVMNNAYLGPQYSERHCERLLTNAGIPFRRLPEDELLPLVASHIANGRIVGWFQGRMEFGPRALGARSILADPRLADMKEVLNDRVKHREWFRPYGVSVMAEHYADYFVLSRESPFMLLVGAIRPGREKEIPAAVHVDGTCRLQTVTDAHNGVYYRLIREFHRQTGVPMVINTSFNVQEPIVCTPEEAIACYSRTQMDCLVLGSLLAEKAEKTDGSAL